MNPAPTSTRRFGLIGCGRIGAPVLAAWQAGMLPGWELTSVLVRQAAHVRGPLFCTEPAAFLRSAPEVVLELAGPQALATLAVSVLQVADLWTVSATALADDALLHAATQAAQASGHRLRILPGAFAGLDGVAAAAQTPDARLQLDIDLPPGPAPAELRFEGSVREAARRFPHAVNVAVAAALAGPGLDATRITVRHPGPVPRHRLALRADSAAGRLTAEVQPDLSQGVHPVACSVMAALRRETQPVWVG